VMRPIVNMPEEDRATDIGNMHTKFGKDRVCGSGDILVDRQTYSLQYLATAPVGKVTTQVTRIDNIHTHHS